MDLQTINNLENEFLGAALSVAGTVGGIISGAKNNKKNRENARIQAAEELKASIAMQEKIIAADIVAKEKRQKTIIYISFSIAALIVIIFIFFKLKK